MASFLMGLAFLLAIVCFGVAVAVPTKRVLQRRLLVAAIALVVISGLFAVIFVFNN